MTFCSTDCKIKTVSPLLVFCLFQNIKNFVLTDSSYNSTDYHKAGDTYL